MENIITLIIMTTAIAFSTETFYEHSQKCIEKFMSRTKAVVRQQSSPEQVP